MSAPDNPLRARCRRLLDRVTGESWPWGSYEQVEAILTEIADAMDDRTGTGVA